MSAPSGPDPRPAETTETTIRTRAAEAGKPAGKAKSPEPAGPAETAAEENRLPTRSPSAKTRGGQRTAKGQETGKARKDRRSRGKKGTTVGRSPSDRAPGEDPAGVRDAAEREAGAESATATFETNTITLPSDPAPLGDPIHLSDQPPQPPSGADPAKYVLDLSSPLPSGVSADPHPTSSDIVNTPHLAATDVTTPSRPVVRDAPAPLPGVTPPAPPYLAALTGLTILAVPFAVAGLLGAFITLDSKPTARILAGCSVGFDLLLVLCGVSMAWRSRSHRKGLWGMGIGPLLAGLSAIGGAAFLDTLEPNKAAIAGLATLGRALTGVGTGTLTVYWLRANTGSVRLPEHRPSIPDRVRTSRTATLLSFTGLILCGVRTDVLTSTYLLPVELFSAWLVIALIRAPHSPITLLLNRIGRIVRRSAPQDDINKRGGHTSVAANHCVVRSGRVIDLDQIPMELRLLPLPRKAGQEEQRVDAVQTE